MSTYCTGRSGGRGATVSRLRCRELLLSIMDEGDFEGISLKNMLLLTSDNVWKLLVMYLDYGNGLQSCKFHI